MKNHLTPFFRVDSMIDEFFNDRKSFLDGIFFDRSFTKGVGSYNIVKVSDNVYQIVLNVAGFKREDIEITHDGDMLIIKGAVSKSDDKDKYIYQGFSSSFHNSFSIGSEAEILGAEIKDGMLVIDIKDNKRITSLPKKIAIK